jgi:3-isopropylmalate/(R)-2-methylmalate dehydratase small subunit
VDFYSGKFVNHTRNIQHDFPAIPEALRDLIAQGGNDQWLKSWWASTQHAARSGLSFALGEDRPQ